MRKAGLGLILLFVLTLAVSLLFNTPVRQLFRVVSMPQGVAMQGLEGSISRGRIAQLGYQGLVVEDLDYHLRPWCLIKLAVCYALESADNTIDLQLQINPLSASVSASDSRLVISDDWFSALPGMLVQPSGDFVIDIESVSLQQARLQELNGRVSWNQAGVKGEEQVLGNYSGAINQVDDGLELKLDQSTGLLTAAGEIKLTWNGSYDVDMTLNGKAGLEDSINSALELVAQKTGLNRYRIDRNGRVNRQVLASLQRLKPLAAN